MSGVVPCFFDVTAYLSFYLVYFMVTASALVYFSSCVSCQVLISSIEWLFFEIVVFVMRVVICNDPYAKSESMLEET